MKINITRVDKTLPLPKHHTKGSVGFDIYSRIDAKARPDKIIRVPTNLIIKTPSGFALIIASRSSLSKRGLILINGIGVIDQDYCGPGDEISLSLKNFTGSPVEIKRGERLAQGMIIPVEKAEWVENDPITKKNRGGYGSTGV